MKLSLGKWLNTNQCLLPVTLTYTVVKIIGGVICKKVINSSVGGGGGGVFVG